MPIAERSLVWRPQCANCRFENDELYCKSINGKWVKLPRVVTEQAGYCQRFVKKWAAGNEKS